MTETLAPTDPASANQYFAPNDQLAAEVVFDGIYQSFADHTSQLPHERKTIRGGVEQTIAVDPAKDFVRARFERAAETVARLDRPMKDSIFTDQFMQEATAEANSVYARQPEYIDGRIERAKDSVSHLMDRTSQLFRSKSVDGLTIKLFLDRIGVFKYGLTDGYNIITTKTDETIPDQRVRDTYAHTVHGLFSAKQDVNEQESSPILHINANRYHEQRRATGSEIVERYYISPKLNEHPEEVLKIWTTTLEDMGLDDKLYYKVSKGIALSFDLLVNYATTETADAMETAIQEFARRCPPEFLSDTIMPAGLEVAKGIARAPELNELNTLLRYRGMKTLSYNQFACGTAELSLRRASYDFMKQGLRPEQVPPEALAAAAKPYFLQFVALSGIDPTTMRPLPA